MTVRVAERDWQARVVDLAKLFEWRYMHVYPLRRAGGVRTATTTKGWPDLILVRRGRMLVVELKADDGRLSPEQQEWLQELRLVQGLECYVWRPRDWDEVCRLLTDGRVGAVPA